MRNNIKIIICNYLQQYHIFFIGMNDNGKMSGDFNEVLLYRFYMTLYWLLDRVHHNISLPFLVTEFQL